MVLRFVARRLVYSAVVLFGVLVVVFALVHLVPGDPVRIALGTRYTPEAYEALRSASGLDRPLISQFFGYIGSALTGDLGVSFRNGDPVTVTLLERLPATLELAFGAEGVDHSIGNNGHCARTFVESEIVSIAGGVGVSPRGIPCGSVE